MKLGSMQPYFFPYIGYLDLIAQTDVWVVFDTAQYIRHGWVNRNRVLHPKNGWIYILAPVRKHSRETPIFEIRLAEPDSLGARIVSQLNHYRGKAPFFRETVALVKMCFDEKWTLLSHMNVGILKRLCGYLNVPFQYQLFSEWDLPFGTVDGPGDWALRMAEALGADEYVNPPGGAALFDPAKFARAGIKLTIQEPVDFRYETPGYQFEPNLSIIDVLMWNPVERVRKFLLRHRTADA